MSSRPSLSVVRDTSADTIQAQPRKHSLEGWDEQEYEEKLLAKARVITDSANRLWRE